MAPKTLPFRLPPCDPWELLPRFVEHESSPPPSPQPPAIPEVPAHQAPSGHAPLLSSSAHPCHEIPSGISVSTHPSGCQSLTASLRKGPPGKTPPPHTEFCCPAPSPWICPQRPGGREAVLKVLQNYFLGFANCGNEITGFMLDQGIRGFQAVGFEKEIHPRPFVSIHRLSFRLLPHHK